MGHEEVVIDKRKCSFSILFKWGYWYQGVNYMLECCKLAWVLQSWPKLMMHYFEVGNHYLVFWAHSPSKLKQHCVGGGVGEVDRQPRCWQKFKVSWDFGSELFVYHFMHVFRLTSYYFFFILLFKGTGLFWMGKVTLLPSVKTQSLLWWFHILKMVNIFVLMHLEWKRWSWIYN